VDVEGSGIEKFQRLTNTKTNYEDKFLQKTFHRQLDFSVLRRH
jgi:hypothetical protein